MQRPLPLVLRLGFSFAFALCGCDSGTRTVSDDLSTSPVVDLSVAVPPDLAVIESPEDLHVELDLIPQCGPAYNAQISPSGGTYTITLTGTPGARYDCQWGNYPVLDGWMTFETVTASSFGVIQCLFDPDGGAPSSAQFRAICH